MQQRNSPERAAMLVVRREDQRSRTVTVRRFKPTKNDNPEYRK